MWIAPKNPKILELTTEHRSRRINLGDLDTPLVEGKKACVWCLKHLTGRKLKWCSQECSTLAFAWANPQKEGGLHILLARQGWKCAICQFDYTPTLTDSLAYMNRKGQAVDPASVNTVITERLMKILKYKVPTDRLPEVDHIIPFAKGGQAIGFDNHQALCYTCHKEKSKLDNSGPRKKKDKMTQDRLAEFKQNATAAILPILRPMSLEQRQHVYSTMTSFLYDIMKTGTFEGQKLDDQDVLEIIEWCRENV